MCAFAGRDHNGQPESELHEPRFNPVTIGVTVEPMITSACSDPRRFQSVWFHLVPLRYFKSGKFATRFSFGGRDLFFDCSLNQKLQKHQKLGFEINSEVTILYM